MSLARIIAWIDRSYDNGVATSNMILGMAVSFVLICGLAVTDATLRAALVGVAITLFVFFGWRMILSFKRQADASDQRKKRNG